MDLFASSSSSDFSSAETHQQYQIFISFRGEDTRCTFVSHLREALHRRAIVTFTDKELQRGEEISLARTNAIEKSKVAVVIFSKHYASSKWCLNELVKILECKKGYGQTIIPVFYHVNLTDVRKQTGDYAKSFAKHEEEGTPEETLQTWRMALTEASNLSGYDMAAVRNEDLLTEVIVDDIWKELRVTYKIDNKNLVGIESKVEKIKSLLNMGSGDVVGIWGIGGIGKTTLANAVFNKIRDQFEGSCFLRNIREESEKDFKRLRQQLYSDISGEESGKIVDMRVTLNFLLARKKFLIVFDDVTNLEQIKKIVGDVNRFNRESRFIVTTRDKQVLRHCGCKEENIYEVNGLCAQEADELFSRFAFKQEHPLEDYMELSWKMVDYATGSPLALEVLGSYLFCKTKREWESAIEKLKTAPDQEIQGVLRLSFDGLDDEQKNLFLDVACFFKGMHRKDIANLYDYNIEFTLRTLIDRCLVSVDSIGRITMHDLLEEMGRQIVREESIESPGERSRLWHPDDICQVLMTNQIVREESIENPDERSRLWHPDDICQVLTSNEGTRAIKGISFDMSKTNRIYLNKNSFMKMSELWFLNIYSSSSKENLSCSEDFQCPSPNLRFLCWDQYPLRSLQSSFSLKNLVTLRMRYSKVEQLWNGVQLLPNLKTIDFRISPNLTAIPDLSLAPKLEEIDFFHCRNLTSLPPCDRLKSLSKLNLRGCKKLVAIPELSCNIIELNLHGTRITFLPSSIGNLSQLSSLFLNECHELSFIPKEFSRLKSIQCLVLNYCHKLQFLPDLPRSLKYLHVEGCSSLEVVPKSSSILLATTKEVSFNQCYMLDNDAFTTIIHDALLEIQRRFWERPAQTIEEDEDGGVLKDLSYIYYSGCEIPENFEFQHLGSTISEELSHDMIGGNIVGFAFFVVYEPCRRYEQWQSAPPESLTIKFHCKTTSENGECFPLRRIFKSGCLMSTSEHESEVVVGYTSTPCHLTFPSQYKNILLELEFSFGNGSCYEVERCGLHLFLAQYQKKNERELPPAPVRINNWKEA